ncbi:unnamed protein product [Plutella xylostella]|uniref:(diamondback moth) hypothetical protein n=1 Tax=Plutella xylostella TaxID=51655 RepID=A0A8S4G787_PLUXY|nr:unnamed protein product [Plutella xylostella]
MSDYDDDELPPISVNIFDSQSMQLNMPDADVLALQRAQEAMRDMEIRRLREQAGRLETGEVALFGTDSSGSEGEASLAATLDQLAVIPSSPTDTALPPLDALLEVFAENVPGDKEFCRELLQCLKEARSDAGKVVDCLVSNVTLLLTCDDTWMDEEFLNVCVSLLSVCACGGGGRGRGARGAAAVLRQLVDNVATRAANLHHRLHPPVPRACCLAAGVGGAAGRGGGRGERVAAAVAGAALRRLLGCDWTECTSTPVTVETLIPLVTSSWRGLDAKTQYQAVLLLGRTLRAIERGDTGGNESKRERSKVAAQNVSEVKENNEKVTETNGKDIGDVDKQNGVVCDKESIGNKGDMSIEIIESEKDLSTNKIAKVSNTSSNDKENTDEKEKGDLTILSENLEEVLATLDNDSDMAIDNGVITLEDTIIETVEGSDNIASKKEQVSVTDLVVTENIKESLVTEKENNMLSVELDRVGALKTKPPEVMETNDVNENIQPSEDDVIEVKVQNEVISITDDEDVVMLERDADNSMSGDGIALTNKIKVQNSSESELLATLKHLTTQSANKHHPDRMKVVVGVDKLQLLLGNGW